MTKYANLIEAIKAVRMLPQTATRIEKNIDTGHYEIVSTIGLKDAKDMVEAVMELGVQRFLADELKKRQPGTSDICGAQDASGKWRCNLRPGHGGGVHIDHVSGRHFIAGGYEVDNG
jgi:hypothetical protein